MSKLSLNAPSTVAMIAGAIFVLSFLLLMFAGDYGFFASVFMALVIALFSGIIIYLGFGDVVGGTASRSASETSEASAPAAKAAEPAKAPAETKPAEPKPADPKPEEPKAEATPEDTTPQAPASPAESPGEDYDGDGVHEGTGEGTRPAGLDAPRDGAADDLKQIKGIGPKLEKLCNSLGFWHFDQVAAWTSDEVAWVDANLTGFKGRVSRDEWVEQAQVLASGGTTEFASRVEDGDVY